VAGEEFFWLRYKAKNSYGAFMSSNMACAKKDGKWVRDTSREVRAMSAIQLRHVKESTNELKRSTAALQACKTDSCKSAVPVNPDSHVPLEQIFEVVMKRGAISAEEVVLESLQTIPEDVSNLQPVGFGRR